MAYLYFTSHHQPSLRPVCSVFFRRNGHALKDIMGNIEHSACESYRTCCRDGNLSNSMASASFTCSLTPHTNVTADQVACVFIDGNDEIVVG